MTRWPRLAGTSVVVALLHFACARDVWIGADHLATQGEGGGGTRDASGDVIVRADAGPPPRVCHTEPCAGHIYACGDCVDNDGDGLIDMDDPDCLGACHNSEDSFFGSIPGQNHAPCDEDCYFDQDSGSGNDGCTWSHACDPLAVAPDFPPGGAQCAYDPSTKLFHGVSCAEAMTTQVADCAAKCGPLTPNGCDCFGCCAVPGAPTPIWLGSVDADGNPSCDLAHVGDPSRCKPCTQVTACLNPCDTCELCVGKQTLPPSCPNAHAPPSCSVPECAGGVAACGVDCLPACPDGQVCITGCCRDIVLQ
jgi:hypothetical protein